MPVRSIIMLAGITALAMVTPVTAVASTQPRPTPVLTLITGDQVHATASGYGIQPAKGRENTAFLHTRRDGEDVIMPADALRLVADGRLDKDLFNVTKLAKQGITGAVPFIVTYDGRVGAADVAGDARELPSINGLAVSPALERAGAFWKSLSGGGIQGIRKIWLDARLRPVLDQSTPQVGAPGAWQAGFTGRDVLLADLDTGWDPGHPDLAGRVVDVKDFVEDGGKAIDRSGHGMHTAGTIAGSGAASGGRFKGVAPDAKLVVGKVCDDDGFCPESSIIAGMEWAAGHGAKAVNLSLGSDEPSDGTDPVSEAVNTLTKTTGTLFVAAAGNSGEQVGSPAAADLALTVGSVDKQDQLSGFSSRGPRLGDNAIKPDVTAPGEAIVAARAKGTSLGTPVDEFHTRLSGTSMATPHVTGAIAVLAQKYPSWTAADLKAAIAGNATPDASNNPYQQGSGRLELRKLLSKPVHAGAASISFGTFPEPFNQPPVSSKLNYTNVTDADVTLNLALEPGNAPTGMFRLDAGQVTVPAHGTAAVIATADPSSKVPGTYSAVLTATSGGSVVRTPLGASLFKKPPSLVTNVIDRQGGPAALALGSVVNNETGDGDFLVIRNGKATTELAPGSYDIAVLSRTDGPGGTGPDETTAVTKKAVHVTADGGETTVDARQAKPVHLRVDQPGAEVVDGSATLFTRRAGQGFGITMFTGARSTLYAVAANGHTDDTFAYRPILGGKTKDGKSFRYQLAFVHPGGVPDSPTYHTPDRRLARFDTKYFAQGLTGTSGVEGDNGRLTRIPGLAVFKFYDMAIPSDRVEFYTADPSVDWFRVRILLGESGGSEQAIATGPVTAGRSTATWFRPPVGVAWGDPRFFAGVARNGNQLTVGVQPFAPSDGRHYLSGFGSGDPGKTTLTAGTTVIGTNDTVGQGEFTLSAGKTRYTLTTTGTREAEYSNLKTTNTVEWTFDSASAPAATRLPLSVLQLGVGAQNDLGQVRAGCVHELTIAADPQPGSAGARTRVPTLEVSYDDGKTWKRLIVGWNPDRQRGSAFAVEPGTPGFVSLRASATNTDGSKVVQTLIRAYELIT